MRKPHPRALSNCSWPIAIERLQSPGININTVTAERNFVVQLYEAAGSEISLELQLASSHTYQKLVVAVDVDIHPFAAAAERNFLVQPHEVA
jgi:ureidoglycolate hydrolase